MEVEKTRQLRSRKELGEVLLKHREGQKWDRKTAAAKASIRPIRLKELEEANENASLEALFNILDTYRIKIALILR